MDFIATVWTVNYVISGFKFASFSGKKSAYYGSASALFSVNFKIGARHEFNGVMKFLTCFCNLSRLLQTIVHCRRPVSRTHNVASRHFVAY